MYSDKTLTCADCGQQFVFTASEQDFYAQRGFTEPRRCPTDRAARKAARQSSGAGYSSGYGDAGSYGGAAAVAVVATAPAAATARAAAVRPRPARDVQRHLLELRQRGTRPVPPDERQARLLLRLLPHDAGLGDLTDYSALLSARGSPEDPRNQSQ